MKFLGAWHLEPCGKFSLVYSSLPCQCARYEGVWGSEAIAHSFLTSILDGGERSGLNFGRFTSKNELLGHPLKRRLELKAGPGMSGEEMNVLPLQGIEAEFIGRAARNLYVLYQLSYPGCKTVTVTSTLHSSMTTANSTASLNFPLSTCGKNDDVTFPSVTKITRLCHETKECLIRGCKRR